MKYNFEKIDRLLKRGNGVVVIHSLKDLSDFCHEAYKDGNFVPSTGIDDWCESVWHMYYDEKHPCGLSIINYPEHDNPSYWREDGKNIYDLDVFVDGLANMSKDDLMDFLE